MKLLRATLAIFAFLAPQIATAEDAPALNIELNAADTLGKNCRLTFLLQNTLGTDIDGLVAETVLFSSEGQVMLLTLFDFGSLPNGRPRVRQFQVPGQSCDTLGQVLVNGFDTCVVGGAASEQCQSALNLGSRLDIKLEG